MIQSHVEAHETAHDAVKGKCGAVACKQSFRGVVVVRHICAQVMLTGVVGGRRQTAHRSHLSSHTTVGLEAQQAISGAIGERAGSYGGVSKYVRASQQAAEVHPGIPAVSRPLSRLLARGRNSCFINPELD